MYLNLESKAVSETPATTIVPVFKPMPGHTPRSAKDRCKRIHRYVSSLATAASAQLKQALFVLRNASTELPSPELQAAARKQYSQAEFLSATKELLCIWVHLEAVDQGGETMSGWLIEFLQFSLASTDFVIEQPSAQSIMEEHGDCTETKVLIEHVCQSISHRLGYGPMAKLLAPAFAPLLEKSRLLRQQALRDALTIDAAEL
ncbi:MAG TPA: hypothetical protein V6D22_25465 [Candidatus Obscuribacterales bacterium]